VRIGIVLRAPLGPDAARAEELGFALAWIDARVAPAPLVAVAAVAQAAPTIALVAAVEAGLHPVTLAEEAAVADLAGGGRLVLALSSPDAALLGETLDVLALAWSGRPFRHAGARWRVPAALPEHAQAEERTRVTPPPAQLEPTVWVAGRAAPATAVTHALAFVAGDTDPDAAGQWRAVEAAAGPAAARLRRPALLSVAAADDGRIDHDAVVRRLLDARAAWGMDVAVLALPDTLSDAGRERALRQLARDVRPRVQLDALPDGLERYWRSEGDGDGIERR
jgi:alkanesulfonate monooxygenase SsuD/methylene tetrahydromethanopterin reductase-like flavin-dependent oxidoreductase (luciferase family)